MILDKKHAMQQKLFRQFAETEFTKELQDELDNTGEFNWEMHKKMSKYGFMGVKIPKEYGGAGCDYLTYALLIEEFARQCSVLSIYANTSNSLGGGPLMLADNEEQKKKYLPLLASGEKIRYRATTSGEVEIYWCVSLGCRIRISPAEKESCRSSIRQVMCPCTTYMISTSGCQWGYLGKKPPLRKEPMAMGQSGEPLFL